MKTVSPEAWLDAATITQSCSSVTSGKEPCWASRKRLQAAAGANALLPSSMTDSVNICFGTAVIIRYKVFANLSYVE